MKLFFLLLSICLFLVNSAHFGKDKLGVSSNNGDSELAVSYSVANTNVDQYYAQNSGNYKSPQLVKSLPRRVNLNSGEAFTPEIVEKHNSNDYYDGTKRLNLKGN